MLTRRSACAGLISSTALLASSPSWAQAYPSRPIRLVLPYAAGGGTDAIARVVAQSMSEKLGSVIVENIVGAGGNNATTQVAAAPPDGLTVLMANQGPMVVNPHLFKNMKVDPLTAFDPVTLIAAAPLVVIVSPKSPHKTLKDLIDEAKKSPGKLNYGSAGNGSASHLATILLAQMAGIDIVHVPYRGAAPAITDVMGGNTQFMITTVPSVVGLIQGNEMRPLAVTTKKRAAILKDVPTIAESGYPDYEASAWYGFVVPKGTPPAIVDTLRKATVEAINSPLVKERLDNEGAEPIGNTGEEFAAYMKAESAKWAKVTKDAKITLD
jgi:tripartite-type tricarboxylate transporter receptor subunit TctC